MYLLDTNCVSELSSPRRGITFATWLQGHSVEETFISVITLGEIQRGVSRLPEGVQRRALAEWMETRLLRDWGSRTLDLDAATVLAWGEMVGSLERSGYTLPRFDSLIAATARVHNLTVVTRNERDFQRCGVKLENPWRD